MVRLLIDILLPLLFVGGIGGTLWATRRGVNRATCSHPRWTRWRVVQQTDVHLYADVDNGRELPDRVDALLRRECRRCGLPQFQTQRGLDARHLK